MLFSLFMFGIVIMGIVGLGIMEARKDGNSDVEG
jgi:hypothetical protein